MANFTVYLWQKILQKVVYIAGNIPSYFTFPVEQSKRLIVTLRWPIIYSFNQKVNTEYYITQLLKKPLTF